jgi:hypothetical protein
MLFPREDFSSSLRSMGGGLMGRVGRRYITLATSAGALLPDSWTRSFRCDDEAGDSEWQEEGEFKLEAVRLVKGTGFSSCAGGS